MKPYLGALLTASFLSSPQLLSSKWVSLPASFAFYFLLVFPPSLSSSLFLSIFITVLLTRSSSFLLQLQLFPVFSMLLLAVVTKHFSFLPVYIFFFLLSSFFLPIPVSPLTWKILEKQKEHETWKFQSHRKTEHSSLPQQRLCLHFCSRIIWN